MENRRSRIGRLLEKSGESVSDVSRIRTFVL